MIYGTLDVKNMPPKIAAKGRATQDMRYALKVMRQHPLYCRWTTSKPPSKFGCFKLDVKIFQQIILICEKVNFVYYRYVNQFIVHFLIP